MELNNSTLGDKFYEIEDKIIKGDTNIKNTYDLILIIKLRENIEYNKERFNLLIQIYSSELLAMDFDVKAINDNFLKRF